MSNPAKFVLRIPAAKPGDFVPSGFAVFGVGFRNVVLTDGEMVTAIGPVVTEIEDEGDEDECVIQFREVRLSCGFEGRVVWVLTDGKHSGFEPVGEYYHDLDASSSAWCVFHTETSKAYASYSYEGEAKEEADKRNRK